MTIPDEAVQAALKGFNASNGLYLRAQIVDAITSSLPFLTGVKVGATDIGNPIMLVYTNHRGETSERTITPINPWFGSTEWHPEPQWLMTAFDHEKQANRDFALKDFGYPAPSPRAQALEEAAQALEAWGDIYGDNAAKCVRTLSSQPVADGWLPIETAKKDPNTVILVLLPRMMNLIVRARYNSVHGYWITDCDNDGRISKPTFFHPGDMWHPMPALPASPGVEG